MGDQLEGRDLDRACAEAMHGPSIIWRHWSTDPSTQAEKLAWLHEKWALCVIIGHYTEKVGACAASPVAQNLHAEGTTIDEALAALVVAVAKAKKEQGK